MRLACRLSRRRFLQSLATMAAVASSKRGWGLPGAAFAAANVTQSENAKPGSPDWELTQVALNREIEGYASRASVGRGEQIQLFVNTADPTYTIDVFRMGWYGGLGARRILPTINGVGMMQAIPTPDPVTGLVECNWISSCMITTSSPTDPTEWPSGVYLAKLTGASGKQSYIVFAIRDDPRASAILCLCATNTYQAYNNWGGKSLYDFNSTGPRAAKVSYNRPYAINPYGTQLDGAGDFLRRWEYNMVRFLEREGYDVAYTTDVDAHMSAQALLPHKGLLIVGHNEYWSWGMRQNIIATRDAGVGLGFFAANNCFWQIRYEQSSATGNANRTIVCYKDATTDPYALDTDSSNDRLVTVQWRDAPVNLPEGAFIGVQYGAEPGDGGDIVIENAASWVCSNTGLQNGDHLLGLLGYEVDAETGNQPAGTQRIAHSPVPHASSMSDMTVYTASSGATVFATGSMNFNWGLDGYNAPALHPNYVNAAAQQMARNVLAAMVNTPPGAPTNLTAKTQAKVVQLAWRDNSTNEISFRIERSLAPASGFAEIASTGGGVTSYTDPTVSRKTTYYYRVRAATANQYSAYSNTAQVTVR